VVRHRDRVEIVADLLKATGRGARKTRIMYGANLSYRLLKKYLEESVDKGFVRVNDGNYEVTRTGEEFLKRYVEVSSRYSKIGKELRNVRLERAVLERMCRSKSVELAGAL
jgi:predicted transcriptional regulator